MRKTSGGLQVRCQHASDRALIGCAVGVSAHLAIYGTDVQARAAANAFQNFAMFGAGENLAASIVEEHDVKLFGPVYFVRLTWSAN